MIFHWPQVTILFLYALGIAVGVLEHGKPRTGKYNMFATIFWSLLGATVLYYGHFWSGGCL